MQKRRTNLYKSGQKEPFSVSRSKIALFSECPQCFYLDRKLGIARPDSIPFTLNNKVDELLKREFDLLREKKQSHPLMSFYNIEAIPYWHPNFPIWRDDNNQRIGALVLHKETHLNIHGIVDDIWVNKNQELHIVDYKSTSTQQPISLDGKYKEGYKKQIEVYQWIFRRLGFNISSTGYFLFANAGRNREGFFEKLEFENSIISHQGDDSWVEGAILNIKKCLDSSDVPESAQTCQYCSYRKLINNESLKNQMSLI